MRIFGEKKITKVINILDNALTDKDDELAKLKKHDPGIFGILSLVLDGINKWRERALSLILHQIDILDITVNTKKIAGVFESEIDNSAQKVASLAAATEEMSATAKEIAKNAVMAVDEAAGTAEKTKEGTVALDELILRMKQVEEAVYVMGKSINQFVTRTQTITGLTDKVKEIAAQTNLLSLNAAIEAARAGEHGRGFAVVADEVRNLAEKSAQAAKEIEQVTSDIGNQSKDVESKVAEGLADLKNSQESLSIVSNAINVAETAAAKTKEQVTQIAASAEEQSQVAAEMAANLSNLTENMEELQSLFNEMGGSFDKVINDISKSVTIFSEWKFDCMLLNIVKSDHLLWVTRALETLSKKETSLKSTELADHHQCRLGKWYDTVGKEKYGNYKEFIELGNIHPKVHETGRALVDAVNAKRLDESNVLASKLVEYKNQVLRSLDDLIKKIRESNVYQKN
ncbi:MAG: methyl-accepting chemotaxis protein [bacterium]